MPYPYSNDIIPVIDHDSISDDLIRPSGIRQPPSYQTQEHINELGMVDQGLARAVSSDRTFLRDNWPKHDDDDKEDKSMEDGDAVNAATLQGGRSLKKKTTPQSSPKASSELPPGIWSLPSDTLSPKTPDRTSPTSPAARPRRPKKLTKRLNKCQRSPGGESTSSQDSARTAGSRSSSSQVDAVVTGSPFPQIQDDWFAEDDDEGQRLLSSSRTFKPPPSGKSEFDDIELW